MFYKIDLDESQRETINVLIRLPGNEGHNLHLSFRLNPDNTPGPARIESGHTPGLPAQPILADNLELAACQDYLVALINHLVASGQATYAGKYQRGTGKIPLFRSDNSTGLYVDSVDKKTGQNLLKGILIKTPDKVRKLAAWIVSKFPAVSDWAGVAYHQPIDEHQLTYIIIMAARAVQAGTLTPSRRE